MAEDCTENLSERKRTVDELEKATEAAEAANRSKSYFLAAMSHEIRTPLNAIIGYAGLVMETQLTPQQHSYVARIAAAGESLLKTINDLLDVSRVEAGRMELEITPFSLDEVLAQTMAMVRPAADGKGLRLLPALVPELPGRPVGDPHRLGQVLTNLLANAVKFTKTGEVAVGVSLHGQTADSAIVCFSVRDTGIGLPPESLAKLFAPFTQADRSTVRHFGGSGLGLFISKQLVELMGGEIWCESEVGRGSTFSFTARFGIARQSAASGASGGQAPHGIAYPPAVIPGEDEGGVAHDFSGTRVLLVDDNEINRHLAATLLKKRGMKIDVATRGSEAVEKVTTAEPPFDAVLMDIQLPDMDGYEATRRIRADGRFGDLPIIAMTAHALNGEAHRSREAGMNEHITKPINARTLVETMGRLLRPPEPETQ